jgi:hypothetical protein
MLRIRLDLTAFRRRGPRAIRDGALRSSLIVRPRLFPAHAFCNFREKDRLRRERTDSVPNRSSLRGQANEYIRLTSQ